MIEAIKNTDIQLFLWLNSRHNAFFDVLMYWATYKYTWIPLYAFLMYLVYWHFQKKTWLVLLTVAVLITLSDQVSVHCFKEVFQRYRPCHNLQLENSIHLIGNCGGQYGFISSHASNTFALATFLVLLMGRKIKYFSFFILLWAAVVSYSRIYCGAHYPADILGGAIVGMGIAVVVAKFYFYLERKYFRV